MHYVTKNKLLIPNCSPPCQNFKIGYVLDNGKVIVHPKYEVLTRRQTENAADIRNYQQLSASSSCNQNLEYLKLNIKQN